MDPIASTPRTRRTPLAAISLMAFSLMACTSPSSDESATGTTTASTEGPTSGGASETGGTAAGSGGSDGGTSTGAGTSSASAGDTSGGGLPGDGWPKGAFAPFVDATSYPIVKLSQVHAAANVDHFALGFVVAKDGTTCAPSWGTFYDLDTGPSSWGNGMEEFLYDEIDAIRGAGGEILPSLGGAANVPLAAACDTVPELVAAYRSVMDALDVSWLDFDVEGTWVADHGAGGSVERRSAALAQLQDEIMMSGGRFDVWFTLPVLPSGLTPDGVAVLTSAVDAGVAISGVNLMTMDYGDNAAPDPDGMMAEYAIMALQAVHGQLGQIYADAGQPRGEAELWNMLGATPMIGLNDVITERFDLQDAQQLVDFAASKSMGLLSMWSVNRDHPCPTQMAVQLDCSSTPDQTMDWQFSSTLRMFQP